MGQLREIEDLKKPLKGMATDTSPLNQVPNSYRFALNMCVESREGDYSALINEEGNTECFQIEDNEKIIGTILISNGDTIIFIATDDGTYSKISIVDKNCNLTNLITSSCLSFSKSFPIHGTFKIQNGCDRIIYFTDKYNPIRAINLDNLGQYTPKIGFNEQDWIDEANLNDSWICVLFKLNGNIEIPNIDFLSIDDIGGILPVGAYQFAIRYLSADLNPTNWFYITNPVNLGTVPLPDTHPLNSSGGNIDIDLDTPSGRSINLGITNLDIRYKYYQLASIEYREGFGALPTDVFELPKVLINPLNNSDVYEFTGLEDTIEVTLEDIAVPKIIFNKVGSITQTDNRLIIANTEEVIKDYSELQRVASKVHVNWMSNHMEKMFPGNIDGDSFQTDASTGKFSFEYLTYARDEVYALGIVFIFNDGSESPVFHIPGRPANIGVIASITFNNAAMSLIGNNDLHVRNQVPLGEPWDRQLLTVVASGVVPNGTTEVREVNVAHIPLVEFTNPAGPRLGNTIERWKVFNTATSNAVFPWINRFDPLGGILGFYEGNQTYIDILDCNGISIWGDDLDGNPLAGEKIRHHRMPDSTLFPIDDDDSLPDSTIFPIRLQISNVDVPAALASEIQGYYVVKAKRDDDNSTVLDTGMLGATSWTNAFGSLPDRYSIALGLSAPLGPYTHEEDQVAVLISPRGQFRKDIKPSTYLKFDEILEATANFPVPVFDTFKTVRRITTEEFQFRTISDYAYVDKDSIQGILGNFAYSLNNLLINMDTLWVRFHDIYDVLYSAVAADREYNYVTLKQWVKPYDNLSTLEYERTHNGMWPIGLATDARIFGGGDTYLGEMSFRTLSENAKTNQASSDPTWNWGRLYHNFYFESKLNMELRRSGEDVWENHWRNFPGSIPDFLDLIEIETSPGVGWSNEYFVENRDMSLRNDVRLYYPLPSDYDFCSECQNSFPTRIWYSQRSYQETVYDNYRVFLANDYRDLLSNGGEITNLFVYKDQLYAQTPETTWFVATRPQELQSNEGTISVGTGDLLSIPPKKLETVDRGYGGNQDKFSTTVSEFGATFIDADAGKVFNFNGQLNELSAYGMRNWFAENLRLSGGVNDQITGFEINSTVHKNGIGFISTFDPRHNRYILHKKYYRIIDAEWLGGLLISDEYVEDTTVGFNTATGEFYTWPLLGDVTLLNIHEDTTVVEDLSWTISFSYPHNAWISYHSYRPNWMWHDRNNFYTYNNYTEGSADRFGWLHNTREYGSYYNLIHPSTMYLIFGVAPHITKVFNNFELIASTYTWVGDQLAKNDDESIYEAYLHTDRQSSGILTAEVKSDYDTSNPFISIDYDLTTLQVQNNEDTWNLNKFYDLTSDYTLPIFTNDWNNPLYQSKRITDGYIYYPNDLRTDFTKHQFDINPLRGKYLGCFFSYDNTSQNKFVIDFLNTSQNISFK